MDSQLVQRTRYLLQTRIRMVKTCPTPLFPSAATHLLSWLREEPLLFGLLVPLHEKAEEFEAKLRADMAKMYTPQLKEVTGPMTQASLRDATALYLAAVRVVASMDIADGNDRQMRGQVQ